MKKKKRPTVHLVSLGCPKNRVDSEVMLGHLTQGGYQIVDRPDEAKVIVMDEPTSALSAPEVDRLFALIENLKSRGCGIVYITHKMEEIQRIGDRITVLRDGRLVGTALADELSPRKLVHWMVGRDVDQQFPRHVPQIGAERLRRSDAAPLGAPRQERHRRLEVGAGPPAAHARSEAQVFEEIRYVDPGSGVLIRSEHDLDYDGQLDAWTTYESGQPAVRVLDTNGDGESDVWERYAQGRMNARTLDRDADGVKDTFYRYEAGQLAEKRHDSNNDGTIDKVEAYHNRHRVRTEEDRSLNGWMDTWTTYHVVDGREVVARIERDSRDHGKPDVFETYETSEGETRISRKEEDVDGDGTIDIISTYENGKLVQRAISDEALSPL